jgi:hypothetical protein
VAAEAAVAAVAAAAVAAAAVVSEAAAYRGVSAAFADPRRALLGIDKRRFFWPGSGSDPANSSHHWDRRARTAELADNSRSITNTCGTGNGDSGGGENDHGTEGVSVCCQLRKRG